MKNVRLVLMYEGTRYFGFAEQADVPTVSGEIKRSLKSLLQEEVSIIGASRTDRGVHALGQVVNFMTGSKIRTESFSGALNFYLPGDIRVLKAEEVPDDFHSRFMARGKEYCYSIFMGGQIPFNLRRFAYHSHRDLEIERMRDAAARLVGEHDFSSFAQEIIGRPIRRISSIEITEKPAIMGRFLEFRFIGNGFLYKMIRAIMGTLIETGLNKRTPDEVEEILKARDRKRAGVTAPAHGLCLVGVNYGK